MVESNVLAFPAPAAKPGVYLRGQVDYTQIEAVNQSPLKEILKSPAHYEYALAHGKVPTDPMRLGRFVHTSILEPARIASEYAIWESTRVDPDTGETKKRPRNSKAYDAFEAKAAEERREIVRDCDVETAMAMRDAVARHRMVNHYLRSGKCTNETTIVWVEPETRTLCKSRLDRCGVIDGHHYVIDLKGSGDITPGKFAAQCARMLYHFQAAFYSDAYEIATGHKPIYMVAAVETGQPHNAVMYELNEADIEKGRKLYREALTLRAECLAAKSWPGVGNGMVQPLSLPTWAAGGDNDNDLSLIIGNETVGV